MAGPRPQERCARWVLLFALLHTVPAVWITPVVAGTAPPLALFCLAVASLWKPSTEGAWLGLLFLVPALAFGALSWGLAWLLGRVLERLPRGVRAVLLAALAAGALTIAYAPIYVAGGHGGTQRANLFELCEPALGRGPLVAYWIALHLALAALYAGHLLRDGHPVLRFAERWRRPALALCAVAVVCSILYANFAELFCAPLAAAGISRAELCMAHKGGSDQEHWYERAAEGGQDEAIAWMVANARNAEERLRWLRAGAERGDGAMQLALHDLLVRQGAREEADAWLRRAAQRGHVPAMLALAESLAVETSGARADEALAERSELLERAASAGSREARLQLAASYAEGSMGHPVNLGRARALFEQLADGGEPTAYERVLGLDGDYYRARIAEIDAREQGRKPDDLSRRSVSGDSPRTAPQWIQAAETGDAGGALLDEHDLAELAKATDAESQYRYACQLLAGHAGRRAEAKERLRDAAGQGHGDAAWRMFQIHERGQADEIDPAEALRYLQLAAASHHYEATRELALSHELGKRGLPIDLPRAIDFYDSALAAGHDNRYGWNLDPAKFEHFRWLESRSRQARMKLDAEAKRSGP